MSDIIKPPGSVTVVPITDDDGVVNMDAISLAFRELYSTITTGLQASNHPAAVELGALYATLGVVGVRIVLGEPEAERLDKFSWLVADYSVHLAEVGYTAKIDAGLLVIEPVDE